MASTKQDTVTFDTPADEVFGAALGVMQHADNASILAVHNGGHKLIVREKSKLSGAKFVFVWLEAGAAQTQLHVTVAKDDRAPSALLDGKFNQKSLDNYVERVRGALDGSEPAPATPVADHFMQKTDQVPWTDPEEWPDVELGGNFKAMYGL